MRCGIHPYPADTEVEISTSLIQVKLGQKTILVLVSHSTNQPITVEKCRSWELLNLRQQSYLVGPVKSSMTKRGRTKYLIFHGTSNVQVGQKKGEDLEKEEEMPNVDLFHLIEE